MNDTIIRVEKLGKRYRIGRREPPPESFQELVVVDRPMEALAEFHRNRRARRACLACQGDRETFGGDFALATGFPLARRRFQGIRLALEKIRWGRHEILLFRKEH